MAACPTPTGDNRRSTRGPLGLSSRESARRTIIALRRGNTSRHKQQPDLATGSVPAGYSA